MENSLKFSVFIILSSIFLLTGCASISRGVTEALLQKSDEVDNRLCQIRGDAFEGIAPSVKDPDHTAKVLMVHGVGDHIPGYSTQLMETLASDMDLDHISRETKDIQLTDPFNKTKNIGNLRINRLSNEDSSHELLFYELTWSEITAPEKALLAYDNSGEFTFRRTTINGMLKKFSNDTGPDPMIYLGDARHDILRSFSQSFCWMINSQWDELPSTGKHTCLPGKQAINNLKTDKYSIISHSLGSRITIDGLQRIAELLSDIDGKTKKDIDSDSFNKLSDKYDEKVKLIDFNSFTNAFKQQEIPIFMLSNQLPMLQLGRKFPEVTGQSKEYCKADGKHHKSRILSKTSIIAFSDPNDLLSYSIPYGFIGKYIDSRLCADVTNININIAKIIDAFGVGMANPLEAHIGYDTDERVIALLINGIGSKKTSAIVNERCQILVTTD